MARKTSPTSASVGRCACTRAVRATGAGNGERLRCVPFARRAALRTDEVVQGKFKPRRWMREQPSFGDGADAAIAVLEPFQDPRIARAWLQPEAGFERGEGDHALDGDAPVHNRKGHAATVREDLRFEFDGFHGLTWLRSDRSWGRGRDWLMHD